MKTIPATVGYINRDTFSFNFSNNEMYEQKRSHFKCQDSTNNIQIYRKRKYEETKLVNI